MGGLHGTLHQLDGAVAGFDVNTGGGVRDACGAQFGALPAAGVAEVIRTLSCQRRWWRRVTSGTWSASVSRFSNSASGPGSQPVAPAFSAGSSSASIGQGGRCAGEGRGRRREAAEVGALQQVLAQFVRARERDRVLAGEAGGAEAFPGLAGGVDHAVFGDVGEGIGADGLGDFLDGGAVGDQFRTGGEVDAVEARPLDRRGGDLDVDGRGAGFAEHPDDGALGVAADDRVIHHHHALAADHGLKGVQLEPDAQLAQRLRGLDERAAHVGVLDEAVREGDAGFLGVAHGGRGARLRDRDDDVRFLGVFAGQLAAHLHAGFVHGAAGDGSVRAGEVDVFENAAGRRRLREALGTHAVLVDGDEFAGLDFADEAGAHGGQGGLLGGHHPAALQPAQDQRADAVGIAGGVEGAFVHKHEAEAALDLGQQLDGGLFEGLALLAFKERRDQGGVRGVALLHFAAELAAVAFHDHGVELGRVGQVAVVRQGHGAGAGGAEGGLGVGPVAGSGGGVAAVSHRQVPGQGVQRGLVEDLGNEAHVLVDVDPLAVTGSYTSRLLTAVLQCIQPVIGEFCYFFTWCPDPEDATSVLRAFFAREKIMRKFSIAACHWSIISRHGVRLFRRGLCDLAARPVHVLVPACAYGCGAVVRFRIRNGFDDGALLALDAPPVQQQGQPRRPESPRRRRT